MLVNPANASTAEATLREVPEAARTLGLQVTVLNARTSREIEAAFATLSRDRADAFFVAPDAFFNQPGRSRRLRRAMGFPQPIHSRRSRSQRLDELMSYGVDILYAWHQVGLYTGQILKGAKPADLPVVQSTKFEFVINLQTARALGIEIPNSLQLLADEVIE